jgi:hypothetical protein
MNASARTHPVRMDVGVRPRRHARIRADASVLPLGNFITDATMRPRHGRLSGHRPTVRLYIRPSVRYRPRDNLAIVVTIMKAFHSKENILNYFFHKK